MAAKTLYENDFAEWASTTAELIRAGRFSEIEAENVAEEIESLGRAEHSIVHSQLRRLLLRQIKRRVQPQKETVSWRRSLLDSQDELKEALDDSPSLPRYALQFLDRTYVKAIHAAQLETKVKTSDLPE
jgi:uncharacterized protein DUF29